MVGNQIPWELFPVVLEMPEPLHLSLDNPEHNNNQYSVQYPILELTREICLPD